ncbi:hypothetical protein HOD08_03720 [bacterium]|nr:hypothetical protein [bacterium]
MNSIKFFACRRFTAILCACLLVSGSTLTSSEPEASLSFSETPSTLQSFELSKALGIAKIAEQRILKKRRRSKVIAWSLFSVASVVAAGYGTHKIYKHFKSTGSDSSKDCDPRINVQGPKKNRAGNLFPPPIPISTQQGASAAQHHVSFSDPLLSPRSPTATHHVRYSDSDYDAMPSSPSSAGGASPFSHGTKEQWRAEKKQFQDQMRNLQFEMNQMQTAMNEKQAKMSEKQIYLDEQRVAIEIDRVDVYRQKSKFKNMMLKLLLPAFGIALLSPIIELLPKKWPQKLLGCFTGRRLFLNEVDRAEDVLRLELDQCHSSMKLLNASSLSEWEKLFFTKMVIDQHNAMLESAETFLGEILGSVACAGKKHDVMKEKIKNLSHAVQEAATNFSSEIKQAVESEKSNLELSEIALARLAGVLSSVGKSFGVLVKHGAI